MDTKKDITGLRSGRLVVLRRDRRLAKGWAWLCLCDCGRTVSVLHAKLTAEYVRSCGCLRRRIIAECAVDGCQRQRKTRQMCSRHYGRWRERGGDPTVDMRFRHGCSRRGSRTPEYSVWSAMIKRCHNPRNADFHWYGGRGITVCERWRQSFAAFLEDMGSRPTKQHSIDRYPDNNGNYELSNCRWAVASQQSRNTRRNVLLTARGQTKTLADWAEEIGKGQAVIAGRLRLGWDIERAIFTVDGRHTRGRNKG